MNTKMRLLTVFVLCSGVKLKQTRRLSHRKGVLITKMMLFTTLRGLSVSTVQVPSDHAVEIVPDSGHFVFMEQPELFNEALLRTCRPYLTSKSSSSSSTSSSSSQQPSSSMHSPSASTDAAQQTPVDAAMTSSTGSTSETTADNHSSSLGASHVTVDAGSGRQQ